MIGISRNSRPLAMLNSSTPLSVKSRREKANQAQSGAHQKRKGNIFEPTPSEQNIRRLATPRKEMELTGKQVRGKRPK